MMLFVAKEVFIYRGGSMRSETSELSKILKGGRLLEPNLNEFILIHGLKLLFLIEYSSYVFFFLYKFGLNYIILI